jgi:hypothetical protein
MRLKQERALRREQRIAASERFELTPEASLRVMHRYPSLLPVLVDLRRRWRSSPVVARHLDICELFWEAQMIGDRADARQV